MKLNVLVPGEAIAATAAGRYDLAQGYLTRGDPIVLQSALDPRFATSVSHAVALHAYSGANREAAEKLFDAGVLASTDAERARAYGDLQDLLIDNNAAFPIYERVWEVVLSNKISGFTRTAEGFAQLSDVRKAP